jgi:hypothetical protein
MDNSNFQLCLLLRHLDADNDFTPMEKIVILEKLFALPNKEAWKRLVQASIYEPNAEMVFEVLQKDDMLRFLIADLTELELVTQHLSLLPKLCRCFHTLDKTICALIFNYCNDDEGQSVQSYIAKANCIPKPVSIHTYAVRSGDNAHDNIFKQTRGVSMPTCHKLHSEVQRFISTADFKEELKLSHYSNEFKLNEHLLEGEREAASNIEMIDEELRGLAELNVRLADVGLIGRLMLK